MFSLPLYACMKQIFLTKVDVTLHIQFLKLCTAKERSFQFALDGNEKLLINKAPEVLIGVETFTSKSSFNTQNLQFVTMNELKKSMPGSLQFFAYYLVVPISLGI